VAPLSLVVILTENRWLLLLTTSKYFQPNPFDWDSIFRRFAFKCFSHCPWSPNYGLQDRPATRASRYHVNFSSISLYSLLNSFRNVTSGIRAPFFACLRCGPCGYFRSGLLHCWRVNGITVRELLPCSPYQARARGWSVREWRFSSLRYDPTWNRTQPTSFGNLMRSTTVLRYPPPRGDLMRSTRYYVSTQNRRQKVFNTGVLRLCRVAWLLKIWQKLHCL